MPGIVPHHGSMPCSHAPHGLAVCPHQRRAAWPGTAALTCAGAGAAAPLSGSRRSRRNPSLSSGGHCTRARGTAGQAAPEGCWHLPPPCQCRWRLEAHARPPRAVVSGSPSRSWAECWGWLLTAHGGSAGLCRVPRRSRSVAGNSQRHPGTHHAARPEAAPVLRGCGQGPGVASPGLRGPAGWDEAPAKPRSAVLQRPGKAAAPLRHPVPMWHQTVAGAKDGARGTARQSIPCAGACSRWGPAGSGRVRQADGRAGSPAHSRRKVESSASCGSVGLVSPAEQPLALTAKPACEY